WGWGSNNNGQLGNGTTINSSIPVQASGITSATALAGGFEHTLILTPLPDITNPVSVNITSPAHGSAVYALPSINGNATDDPHGHGIAKVSVALLRNTPSSYLYWNSDNSSWQTLPIYFNAT